MPPYAVRCYAVDCPQLAIYKIAACWSDGHIGELKTYFLACPQCLPTLYQTAQHKKAACRLTVGETLSEPMIYELLHGQRDQALVHRPDLER